MNVSDFKGHISGDVRWANNGSYCYFHPNELPFDIEPNTKTMESFISVSKELGKLDGMLSSMDEGEITVLSFAISIKESTSSSSIEGTRSTIDDVFRSRLISPS